MSLRRRRLAVACRIAIVVSVLAGIVLTALGPATITGLLPYFTIQSNVAVGLFAGYAAWRAWQRQPEPPSALKGAVTLYITITGVVYHLVLANPASPFAMTQPERALGEALGNQFLHTVVPVLAIADWALFDQRGRLRFRHAAWWLAFPLAYLGFALLRGLVVHRYPYPFIDAGQLGYDGVSVSAVFFAFTFWLLGLLFVGLDRGLPRRGAARPADGPAPGPSVGPAPAAVPGNAMVPGQGAAPEDAAGSATDAPVGQR
ncbi:Pr6Pr family membrane protein [Micromonospora sp. CPCC 205711]|uniref:Pr6Pr family membrane protein n=1 Tax=Micromonospora sp. CPCC 205547 TaxID=3122400 RepID=UPI002FF2693E